MPVRPAHYLGVAAAALLAGTASAQQSESPVFLGSVLFANFDPVETDRTGTTVTVVEEGDLASQSLRVAEVLGNLPGFAIRPSGGLGTITGFSLRGAPQAYVAVRVDGIDVSDPSNTKTQFDFGQMISGGISRIEVTPGSQSVLFGGNAVGGAINLTSRRATEDGWAQYLDAELGSYETIALSYGVTYRDADGEVAMTVSHAQTEGFSAIDNPGFTEADGFEGTRISLNGALQATAGLRLTFAGFVEESTGDFDGYDSAIWANVDNDARTETESHGLRFGAEFETGPVSHELAVSRYAIERASIDGAVSTYNGDRAGLHYRGGLDVGAAGRLVFGLDQVTEEFEQRGADYAEATTNSAYAELTWAISPDIDLAVSWRHDEHEDFGGFDSGRVAMAWRPSEGWVVRGQVGSGYRAPSLFELHSTLYGDASLSPETSRSADFGIERRIGAEGFVRATAFWLEVEDLIGYDPVTYRSAQTDGTTTRSGLELVASVPLSERLVLNADYTRTISEVAGDVVWAQVPGNVYGLGLAAEITDRIGAGFDIRHVTDRGDLDDYTLANAVVTYDLGNNVEARLRIENLFDEQYHLVDSWGTAYGTPDRSVYLGINASF